MDHHHLDLRFAGNFHLGSRSRRRSLLLANRGHHRLFSPASPSRGLHQSSRQRRSLSRSVPQGNPSFPSILTRLFLLASRRALVDVLGSHSALRRRTSTEENAASLSHLSALHLLSLALHWCLMIFSRMSTFV